MFIWLCSHSCESTRPLILSQSHHKMSLKYLSIIDPKDWSPKNAETSFRGDPFNGSSGWNKTTTSTLNTQRITTKTSLRTFPWCTRRGKSSRIICHLVKSIITQILICKHLWIRWLFNIWICIWTMVNDQVGNNP